MKRRKPDALDAELGQLKKAFQAVAQRHSGEVKDIVLRASECLVIDSSNPDDKTDAVTDAYIAAVEKLEKAAETSPAAASAMEDIGDAVSKAMTRMTRQPGF